MLMLGKQWLFRIAQRTGMSKVVREKMDLLAGGKVVKAMC